MSDQKKALPWFKAPLAEAKPALRKVALREKEPLSRVTFVWLEGQESAQMLDRDGDYRIDSAELALLERVDEETIKRILLAFEAPDVRLIENGRWTTFKKKEKSRDQRPRDLKKAAEAAGAAERAAAARDADSPVCAHPATHEDLSATHEAASATHEAPSATHIAAESSESSSRMTTERKDSLPPSSSLREPSRAEATRMMTDAEIVQSISKIDPVKIPQRVANAGVSHVRRWLDEGFDLESDILPSLARTAARLQGPLQFLNRDFIVENLRAHRSARLAGNASSRAPPIASGAPARRDYEMENLLLMMETAGNG